MSRPAPRTALLATTLGVVFALALVAVAGWWLLDDDEPRPSTRVTVSTTAVPAATRDDVGTDVELPTHDWRPGDGGDDALISGILITDRKNCVTLAHRGGSMTYLLWPAGYRAVIGSDGVLRLRDADDKVVAESGDSVQMAGGFGAPASREHPCVPDKGEVALVQSEVTVTEESEHWQPREATPTGSPEDPAYRAWRTRDRYPSCGEQFLAPYLNGAGLRYADCLRDAVKAGRRAEAVVSMTTVEGDPVTSYLRVRKDGTVEVFTDSTQDKFGSGTWERYTCQRLGQMVGISC